MIRCCFRFITDLWFRSFEKVVEKIRRHLGSLEFPGRRARRIMAPTVMECCEAKSERFNGGTGEERVSGFGSVKFTRGLGRKRIVISSGNDQDMLKRRQFSREIDLGSDQSPVPESPEKAQLKRQRSGVMVPNSDKSLLESLPQDLLIRVLCGVNHDDLQRLFLVSKSVKEAASIAKRSHFAFSTPKKTPAFRNPIDFDEVSRDSDDVIDPPNAPIQRKTYREAPWTKNKRKDLSSVSMALFT
ncbi:PREDICTED: F-box protein SKIP27 [Tarenaya hassleriana]|uniref:F-box protein SKIP27 n=1 Tax=Tarenaya hassleriana TaxID=28532 RepID=UPI0008FD08FC|nr:PREDICTED: F-box protein SKIP27 [Tarenaya hassleriana]